jgi:ribosome-associated protein
MNRDHTETPVARDEAQGSVAARDGSESAASDTDAGAQANGAPPLPEELARATSLAADRKAADLLVLDLRGISNATDFFFLASGTSDMHVRSIAEHVIEELKKTGVRPAHVEGLRTGRWVLLDYIDFVVHVFHPAAREFYQLERLWGDAPAYAIEA